MPDVCEPFEYELIKGLRNKPNKYNILLIIDILDKVGLNFCKLSLLRKPIVRVLIDHSG